MQDEGEQGGVAGGCEGVRGGRVLDVEESEGDEGRAGEEEGGEFVVQGISGGKFEVAEEGDGGGRETQKGVEGVGVGTRKVKGGEHWVGGTEKPDYGTVGSRSVGYFETGDGQRRRTGARVGHYPRDAEGAKVWTSNIISIREHCSYLPAYSERLDAAGRGCPWRSRTSRTSPT